MKTKAFRLYGDDGDRTRDLQIANLALSQLSYIPAVYSCVNFAITQPRYESELYYAGKKLSIYLSVGLGCRFELRIACRMAEAAGSNRTHAVPCGKGDATVYLFFKRHRNCVLDFWK